MIIEFSNVDESLVRWSYDNENWKTADLYELIKAYETIEMMTLQLENIIK